MFKNSKTINNGFTLIELLVVIAIIGILSTIVIASLNSAREKGKIAAIKSSLRNMSSQAEILYTDNSNYSGINSSNSDTTCTGSLADIAQGMISQGATVRCLSYNNSSLSDVFRRWGISSIIYDITNLKAYSADDQGVVTWDIKGVTSTGTFVIGNDTTMNWATAINACATSGGRLPTMEELKTLSDAYYVASGTTASHKPIGFTAAGYWSSTPVPSDVLQAYVVSMNSGVIYPNPKVNGLYVHCVR
jgi:prepilin-type N-terminal cleavage/methylation domain-containing protein